MYCIIKKSDIKHEIGSSNIHSIINIIFLLQIELEDHESLKRHKKSVEHRLKVCQDTYSSLRFVLKLSINYIHFN